MKVEGDQVVLVPRLPIFGGDACHGSHRVVASMFSGLLGDLNKLVVLYKIILTLHVVPQFSFILSLLHTIYNFIAFDCFCMFQKSRVALLFTKQ